ncbi:MAG: hypothetical protein FWF59_02185 [Turicibacter sp.]|nr:hypothetical protein [Turicibacter sp.]
MNSPKIKQGMDWNLTLRCLDALVENSKLDIVCAFRDHNLDWQHRASTFLEGVIALKSRLNNNLDDLLHNYQVTTYPWSEGELDILERAYAEMYCDLEELSEAHQKGSHLDLNMDTIQGMKEDTFYLQCTLDEMRG